MEFQSNGTSTINGVTVPVVYALAVDETGVCTVYPLLRAIDISKMLKGSRTYFNTMVNRAAKNGVVCEEEVDYFSVGKEDAAKFFGSLMLGVPNLRMYTASGFRKAAENGITSAAEGKSYVSDVERYYTDAETSILNEIAIGEDVPEKSDISKIKKQIIDRFEPQTTDANASDEAHAYADCAPDDIKEESKPSIWTRSNSSVTVNGMCLDNVLDKYEDDAPTTDEVITGRPVKMKKSSKKVKNKKQSRANTENHAFALASASGTPSWTKENQTLSSNAVPDMSIEKDWQNIIKQYPGAVKANNMTSDASGTYDRIGDIVTPFPSDGEAPPTPPVQFVTRQLSASERIKNYADSLDKEAHGDAYAAIVMMAAAVAAEGLEDNQITIKPIKKPKKKLFSTDAVAEAFKTSKEVIEKISDELGLRTKKYGKFVTLVKTGDLMLVRFFYNKKAIRKFSEVLTLAGAEELEEE